MVGGRPFDHPNLQTASGLSNAHSAASGSFLRVVLRVRTRLGPLWVISGIPEGLSKLPEITEARPTYAATLGLKARKACALRDSFAHPQGLELGVKNHLEWNHDMVALSLTDDSCGANRSVMCGGGLDALT